MNLKSVKCQTLKVSFYKSSIIKLCLNIRRRVEYFSLLTQSINTPVVTSAQALAYPPGRSRNLEVLEHFVKEILDFTVQVLEKFPSSNLAGVSRLSP